MTSKKYKKNKAGFTSQVMKWGGKVFLGAVLASMGVTEVYASAPTSLNYQGRILKTDGTALEYNNVSFSFKIMNPAGTCTIFMEQVNGVDLSLSNGLFDIPIGSGVVSFPSSNAKVTDVFANAGTYNCFGSGTYEPAAGDVRKLRVSFYDGSNWQDVSPDNVIRSVPYASQASYAEKILGLPTCGVGTFLTWSGTAFSCAGVTGVGSVTEVTSANSYLSVSSGTSTPSLTLNVGTTAGTVAAGDDSRITGALHSGSSAGGDLSGTYPNPTLGTGVVKTSNLGDAAVTTTKVLATNPGLNRLLATNSTTGESIVAFSCSSGQLLSWNAALGWQCINQSSLTVGGTSSFTGSLAGDVTGTQGATIVSKIGGYAVNLSVAPTTDQVLSWNGTNWVAASLPGTGNYLSRTLASGQIFVGNGSNIAAGVALSGDATISNAGVLTLASSGVSAGSYSKVTVDSKGRVTAGTSLTLSDVTGILGFTPFNKAGDTLSGSLGLAQLATDPTGLVSGDKGKTWFNTTTGQVKYWDGSAAQALGVSGSGLTSLNGQSGSTQTFASGSSGADFGISSAGNVHTFNIPSASASTRGLLSSTDWSTFNSKMSNNLASGQVMVGSAGGQATAVSISGDATISSAGALTIANSAITSAKVSDVGVEKISSGVSKYFNYKPNNAACANGEILSYSTASNGWICASANSATGSVTGVTAGAGLTGGTITTSGTIGVSTELAGLSGLSSNGFVKRTGAGTYSSVTLSSADLSDASGLLKASNMPATCSANQTLSFSSPSGAWVCSNIATLDAGAVTAGTFATAQIPALDAGKVTSGSFAAARIPSLDAGIITTGSFATARIPSLDASIITAGTFAAAQIPALDAGKVTSGSFATARIPSLDTAIITTGTFAAARLPSSATAWTVSATNIGYTAGKVGIGTSAPVAALDVVGQTRSVNSSLAVQGNSSASVDWNNGNAQTMSAACTATTLNNMLDGGTYILAVTEQGITTCIFSASGLTFKYSPANAARTTSTDTVYTFQRVGSTVYVSWIAGF